MKGQKPFVTVVDITGKTWHLRPGTIAAVREIYGENDELVGYELYVSLPGKAMVIGVTDEGSVQEIEALLVLEG